MENFDKIIKRAVLHFGAEAQTRKAVEECNELSLALLHALDGRANIDNIAEEIADVEIMIAQLRLVYGDKQIDDWKAIKISRLSARTEEKQV